ncbi:MAG: UDP-N-acetylmuramate--L-alanine ligase [Phycisphaerae bacterium]
MKELCESPNITMTNLCQSNVSTFAGKKIHFIGVGGCGMRALASALLKHGAIISGSDASESGYLQMFNKQGANCWVGHSAEKITEPADYVVISAAVKDDNPELVKLRSMNCRIVKYAQMLGLLMDQYLGVAVSGTHGKSTTTAMTAFVLRESGLDPSFVIGANVDQLSGGSGVGAGKYFVAESCEFDRSFLNLRPFLSAILNIEEDHLDYYSGLEEILGAFKQFALNLRTGGTLVVNGEDENIAKILKELSGIHIETFGLTSDCDWRAENPTINNGCYSFDVHYGHNSLGNCQLQLPGKHNIYNALAATALAHHCGLKPQDIFQALGRFQGAYRRMTLKGSLDQITILDDYAHHPTEIQASLQAARECYNPRRLWCIFQPHQHSRTRFLLNDFAKSFTAADVVVVPEIYFVRDSETECQLVNSGDLVARIAQNGGTACYLPRFDQILQYLKSQLAAGDLVITMGAGDIWKIADELVHWLGRDRS